MKLWFTDGLKYETLVKLWLFDSGTSGEAMKSMV